MFAFVVLDVVFLVLNQEIGWEEYLRNDLFYRMGHRSVSPKMLLYTLLYFILVMRTIKRFLSLLSGNP